jgi:hypothetical protein
MLTLTTCAWIAGTTAGAILLAAGALHVIPKLGAPGRKLSEVLCRAPALDLLITYFTILPLIAGPIVAGWPGLAAAIIGQIVAVLTWQTLHELAHPQARKGPRIVKVLNRAVGPWRNYTAVWITAIAVPGFWIVRVCQWLVYPPLVWLVRLPPYHHAEWVNVSRHKFQGLVGHDLIWCLYCDWMTGIWSLGSEMLRNVESFWCPIRFASDKKCANCAIDFPDIEHGWVPAEGTMAQVAETLNEKYRFATEDDDAAEGSLRHVHGLPRHDVRYHTWFGHPARLTVHGQPLQPVATTAPGAMVK